MYFMTTILVIHAKPLTERKAYMEELLKDFTGKVDYILDADRDELTDEMLAEFFKPGCEVDKKSNAASCAIKHLLACRYIVEHDLEGALILEDDIELHDRFFEKFERSMQEYRQRYSHLPILISYEDSSLQFVPRSQRVKGQWLYESPLNRVRFTGAYYLNRAAAEAIWKDVQENKCDISIDHYQVKLYREGKIQILWCEPPLATQGSFTGRFSSSIGRIRKFEAIRWKLKYAYKRLLYWLR